MFSIKRCVTINASAPNLYKLVSEIENYPKFLPSCTSAKVLLSAGNIQEGELCFVNPIWQDAWVTRNTLTPNQKIEMQLIRGPFKTLQGAWTFTALSPTTCQVELTLNVEPLNPWLEWGFKIAINTLADKLVAAFQKRAASIS